MISKNKISLSLVLTLFLLTATTVLGAEGVYRATFTADAYALTIEVLDDDLAHIEFSTDSDGEAIWTTPMVAKTDYTGPTSISLPQANVIETPELRLEIDEATLCLTATDIARDVLLTTFCPQIEDGKSALLSFTQEGITDIYGLGEQFQRRGGTDGNWIEKRRSVLNVYGNEMANYEGGKAGNAEFPIMYALGAAKENYALFLDDIYQHYWDFTESPFTVKTTHKSVLRWYVMTGADLPDLRRDYMELAGHPPVPPKQMFGLWVSEYGYEEWDELIAVLNTMQAANFPQDGFVLDLQWFGGINGAVSGMGGLAWDEANFPEAAEVIAALRKLYGLGIMTIEESYVNDALPDYAEMAENGYLARECESADCPPIHLNAWWGEGGMVDWTNPDAAAWWHDNRRQHLIEEGVIGHWTDLGEPENFSEAAWYYGFPDFGLHRHADIHNIYNLMWSQSIWEGYQRNEVERRPFILSRSGTAGSQRYGVAMWSGDIAANMPSLQAHLNVQMHMSLSGMDYFGADVGGFNRQVFDPVLGRDGIYSMWLANAVLMDVPLRPHAMNLQNLFATAPSLVGDVASNLANVRLRYELSPYLYTLAHEAYRNGEPLFAPLVYYFQDDPNVRTLGSQKMLSAHMMMATVTGYDIETIPVYLPAGGWFDYYTGEYIESVGEWVEAPTTIDGLLRAPLFVRVGTILPLMPVDDQTLNMLGQRKDGSSGDSLTIEVYSGAENAHFTLIEDDGETMAYASGGVRETAISYENGTLQIAATGIYEGAPEQRTIEAHLITSYAIIGVMLNGAELPKLDAYEDAKTGWIEVGETRIVAKLGVVDVSAPLELTFAR